MYKKYTQETGMLKRLYHKIWLIMRLTTIILLITLLQVSAATKAQNLTLKKTNASLKSIFSEVKKQTGYIVLYPSALINNAKPVTINLTNTPLKDAMLRILQNQNLEFEIQDNSIVVRAKAPSFPDKVALALIDVHGKVVDERNKPLTGVTLRVKNGKQATVTDANGDFQLKSVDDNSILIVSFIGFTTKEIAASVDLNVINLETSTSKLDEVHVIAYGVTSKRLTTGNIGGIKASDIETQPVSNPLLALAGRVPGVFVIQNSGNAGSGVTIKIQGANSISRGNDPFYVVDGSPYLQQTLPTLGNNIQLGSGDEYFGKIGGSGNPFSFLNPADIESIEVLKDADATAIYGSRAANGAILITTKKGKSGKTKIDMTMQSGIGKVSHYMDLLNTNQYLEMRKEAYFKNDGFTTTSSRYRTQYDINGTWDTTRYTNWQKELIGGNANYSDVQASISGGGSSTTFRLNGSYHRETSVFSNTFADVKGGIGLNVNHSSANGKFKIQFSGNYLSDNNQLPGIDLTAYALRMAPDAPQLYHSDGTLNWQRIPSGTDSISTWVNPLSYKLRTYKVITDNLISNLNLTYHIINGLDFNTNIGYSNTHSNDVSTNPSSAVQPERRAITPRVAGYGNGKSNSWIIEPQINYRINLNKGRFEFLLGSTFQENQTYSQQLNGEGYNSDIVMEDFRAAAVITAGQSIQNIYKYTALFARVNYNWEDKYIVNLTTRRDGSSRFGIENQFHNFGAVGAAWLFSNEELFKNHAHWISLGKLRASYGTTGSDQIGDYQYLNQYEIAAYPVAYQGVISSQPMGHSNPYIQWEETKKFQAGLDLGFLKDRILLAIGYFNNRSSNQLLNYSLPITTGFPFVFRNFPATVENSGWEISFNTINVQSKSFTWNSSLNFTAGRNKLISFPGLEKSPYASLLIVGEPVSIEKHYNFAGVNPETGLYQYYDAQGKITNEPNALTDRTVIRRPLQNFYGGLQNSFTYKNIQLDFLFQFVKQTARNFDLGLSSRTGVSNLNQPTTVLNRWQNSGDQTDIQKYSTTLLINDYAQESSRAFSDASYVRLKNLSLSWSLPSKLIRSIHLENCRVFAHGQNLLTFTKYKGLDPETPGNLSLPPLRTYTFGLQVTL
ncbi:TonB-linked outer membrane protein, SusC/RagA family [Mucilaginibacter pineti]|uniref:TonB-linked outer membrane protein, SusC/RagA family n=2 Tax=Mucilaginibacter pineti TaxID=1391627 RepID=A0A1G7GA72_9SPHI|nr:TonB-linked outer membrane protein, SusC/RagA family [Mucilaginibacter pineti]